MADNKMKMLLLEESLESKELLSDFVDILVETTKDDFEILSVSSVGEQQPIQKKVVESRPEKSDVLFTNEDVDITIEEISKSDSDDDEKNTVQYENSTSNSNEEQHKALYTNDDEVLSIFADKDDTEKALHS